MATQKFLALVNRKTKQVIASVFGTADAIPAGDATGRLDASWLPIGVGQEVVVAPSSENLLAGDFVNLFLNAGAINVRKADATTNAKPAHGFVTANVISPANATMFILGVQNSSIIGAVIGTKYLLSKTVPGGFTDIALFIEAPGNIIQEIGIATKATELLTFDNQDYVELA